MGVGERERLGLKEQKLQNVAATDVRKAWCQTADRIRISEQILKDKRIWIIQEYK